MLLAFILLFLIVAIYSRETKFVSTPIGLLPSYCVHKVPSGSKIHRERGGNVIVTHDSIKNFKMFFPVQKDCKQHHHNQMLKKRNEEQYKGWLAFTSWYYPAGIGSFVGNFSVPVFPQSDPTVLYLFTGLQNVDWIPIVDPKPPVFDIIQPVLQYPSDEGYGWSVKSWYVTLDSNVYASDEIFVNVGEEVLGIMSNQGPQKWFISGVNKKGTSTNLTVSDEEGLDSQPWAYNTLECYGCNSCQNEPSGACNFNNLVIKDLKGKRITPKWKARVSPNPVCNEKALVRSPTTVDIYFNA